MSPVGVQSKRQKEVSDFFVDSSEDSYRGFLTMMSGLEEQLLMRSPPDMDEQCFESSECLT